MRAADFSNSDADCSAPAIRATSRWRATRTGGRTGAWNSSPGYKAQRVAEPIPPGLIPQMPVIDAFLAAIGIDRLGVPDYEAEDVISTWTAKASGTVEIVSGDRDLFALIEDPRVRVLYPEKGAWVVVDEAEVTRRYGIPGPATRTSRCCEAIPQTASPV